MKTIRAVVAAAAAVATVIGGTTSAQASTIHFISTSVVTAEESSGQGCAAWLQWTGSSSNPYVRTRGESWGHHCLVDLYRKGRQYHSWHLDYEGRIDATDRMYTGIKWMPDHGYLAKACLLTDSGKKYCGTPW
ncbi:hypothetical protein ACH4Q6_11660 [Streptomyces lydicus]|uniref:hypothetical protein n=1 Tax=Streptomyces lydicus TaxID=47763 RepID=UPI0037AFC8D2